MNATLRAFAWVTAAACISASVCAQGFPNRPIRVFVGFTPGSLTDLTARILSVPMAESLGEPIIVENRPGAGSDIAYDMVARQLPPDGYALVVGNNNLPLLRVFEKDLSFDPLNDLPVVSILVSLRSVLATPAGAPWKTFNEFVEYAKANPGKIAYGAVDPRSSSGLTVEQLKQKNNLQFVTVPYKGTAELSRALWTNEVQLASLGENALPDVQANKIRFLVVSGQTRMSALPDVPTFNELGLPNAGNPYWAFHVRVGTPKPVIDRLYAASSKALQRPEVRDQLSKLRLNIENLSPEESTRTISELAATSFEVAQRAGIKPQ